LLVAGAVHVTVACALPAVAVTAVGAPGTAAGVTAFEAVDAGPVPNEVVAVTVNVYDVPFVRPFTVAVVALPATRAVRLPGDEITV
jgi:hypothetical protein